jgi:8-oxo-dGTP pyrophosphatase MutT (NUDIX family)
MPPIASKQVAALPLRRAKGVTEILLVTSRDTGRWIIPKGWRAKGIRGCKAAAKEAKEEAGVKGKIERKAAGRYRYIKRAANAERIIDVAVFVLSVRKECKRWPEQHERRRAWFEASDAAVRVQEPELASIISAFGHRVRR